MPAIRIGTRPSKLAMKQAEMVSSLLNRQGYETSLVPLSSTGDFDNITPLYESGGAGIFVEEINRAVLEDRVELAVHSAKDLPSFLPGDLDVLAVLPREDPSDVLVSGEPLMKLPPGSVIGTSSLRRIRELHMVRGDLKTANIRGNLDTRLKKQSMGEYDGVIVAKAGLRRLGLEPAMHVLDLEDFLPAPNQGIIAVVGKGNSSMHEPAGKINHEETMEIYRIERRIVSSLNLGCSMPVGLLCSRTSAGYTVRCRFYSNFIREFKEFRISFSQIDALDEFVSNIVEKVPASYGYNFRKNVNEKKDNIDPAK